MIGKTLTFNGGKIVMKYAIISAVVVVLATIACTKSPKQAPVENLTTNKIDRYLQENIERLRIPGFTVAVVRNDSIIYTRAFGVTNADTKHPMTTNNVFHWASVSKTFVATSVMQLWEQGKIDLDEKLITYLPYFKQKDPAYKDITIRQMLNHTSGIGDVDDYEWDKPQYDSGALERFVKGIANDDMLFKPGTDWRYSNTAYETLGAVIAKVSGMSFETYVRKNILDPLEMNTTSFLYPEIPDSLKVTGHIWSGLPVVSKHYPYNRMHGPSSTLNSNVMEMTHYAIAQLHRGVYKDKRILKDSTYNLLWTNSVNMKDKPSIGFAWWIDEHNGLKTISHGGGDTGFRSFLMLVPEKNIGIMVVSNYEIVRSKDYTDGILDILTDKEPKPSLRQIGFVFAEALKSKGLDSAKAVVEKIRADSVQKKLYIWDENQGAYAYIGYTYLNQDMPAEAIEVFKYNVTQFPESGWAIYHLANGYARAKDNALAREHYLKAMKMLPKEEEPGIREDLKKVGG